MKRAIHLFTALSLGLIALPPSAVSDPSGKDCVETALRTLLRSQAPATGYRKLEDLEEIKYTTYNTLNLKAHVGKYEHGAGGTMKKAEGLEGAEGPKSAEQIRELVKVMKTTDSDIFVLQEIEGDLRTLDAFNQEHFGEQYRTFLVKGNDPRSINVGFMIKKDLPLKVEMRTHREVKWKDPTREGGGETHLFTRDLPILVIRAENQPDSAQPLMILAGNHGKSMRPRPGDPESSIWRTAQYQGAAKALTELQQEFGESVPIIMSGDFNTAVDSAELNPLRAAGFKEAFDLMEKPPPVSERISHTYHPRDGPTHAKQMDAHFVSKGGHDSVKSVSAYRYLDESGQPKPIPRTFAEREKNPSDHFPITVVLKAKTLLKKAGIIQ